jgi:hypothetical protein
VSDRNGNGTAPPPTVEQLREDLDRERLSARLARAKMQRTLYESFCAPDASGFGRYPDPYAMNMDGDGWRRLGSTGIRRTNSSSGVDPWLPMSEEELFTLQDRGRYLADTNMIAQGILEDLQNYTVDTGFTWRLEPKDGLDDSQAAAAEGLAASAQAALDEFMRSHDWWTRERECVLRAVREGEVRNRLFVRGGDPVVRFVEPGQIRRPTGKAGKEWEWGIRTDPDDAETIIEYAVWYDNAEPEIVPAGEVFELRRNVDRTIKRGLPDFFSTEDALADTLKLIRNVRQGAALQAAISGFKKMTVGKEAADRAVAEWRAATRPPSPYTGKEMNLQHYPPGSLPVIGPQSEYIPSPWQTAGNANHMEALLAALRALGQRWRMSEHQVSGFTGNIAELSIFAAGSPFVKKVTGEQKLFGEYFSKILWAALGVYAIGGRFKGHDALDLRGLLELCYDPPDVSVVDDLKRTQQRHIELTDGIISKQTWRGEEGYDSEQIKRELDEEPVVVPGPASPPQAALPPADAPPAGMPQPLSFKFESAPPAAVPGLEALVEALRESRRLPVMLGADGAAVPAVEVREVVERDDRGLIKVVRVTTAPAGQVDVLKAVAAQLLERRETERG